MCLTCSFCLTQKSASQCPSSNPLSFNYRCHFPAGLECQHIAKKSIREGFKNEKMLNKWKLKLKLRKNKTDKLNMIVRVLILETC